MRRVVVRGLAGCVAILIAILLLRQAPALVSSSSAALSPTAAPMAEPSLATPPTCCACDAEPDAEAVAKPEAAADIAPEFTAFEHWAEKFAADEKLAADPAVVAAGVKLAQARETKLAALIESQPEAALERTLPARLRSRMPEVLLRHLEKRVSGRGFFGVIATTPRAGGAVRITREVKLKGERYEAFVYGARTRQPSRENIVLQGIVLGGKMAVAESAVRLLEPGETPDPSLEVANTEGACPVSGAAVSRQVAAEAGGKLYYLCSGGHIHALAAQLSAEEDAAAAQTASAPSPWTTGNKTVLFIRVRYSDDATEPQSSASAAQMMVDTSNFMNKNSYGLTSMTATVTPLLTLPQTKAYYVTNGDFKLYDDARVVATGAGFDYGDYDLDCVRFQGGPGAYAGQAYVGFRGCWLKSSSYGVSCHEFGHNFGLWHANYWNFTGENPIGAGSNQEYGDGYDVMGAAGNSNQHYNTYEKNLLTWLPNANVTTITGSGTYHIVAHDTTTTLNGSTQYALRVKKDGERDYWMDFRQLFTTNKWMMSGVDLHWDPWSSSNNGSQIIDTTPKTPDGKNDAPLVIGRTFSDRYAGIHITPIGKGGTSPESLDVVVNLGTFPGNHDPASSISASATAVAVNTAVNFGATASDADGDALAYYWDFGNTDFGPNSANASKSWPTAGEYTVRCVVSDMKGGTATNSVVIRVGAPSVFRVSGRVLDSLGSARQGVRVVAGSSKPVYTNSDGTYTITGLAAGTYSVSAASAGYGMSAAISKTVGPNATGVNFTATLLTWSISGTVTQSGVGLAGVTVSAGARTATTNSSGAYTISNVPEGSYNLTAAKTGLNLSPAALLVNLFGANASGRNFTAAANAPPVIANIADKSTLEDTPTAAIPFTVSDTYTPAASLILSASSSNPTLLPASNVAFGGSGSSRNLIASPAPNQNGTAILTITVDDGTGGTDSDSFVLTVAPVADAPEIASAPTATPNPALAGAAVGFTLAASDPDGDALAFVWNYGDGSSDGTGIHTYASAGSYQASVQATDSTGLSTASGAVGVTVVSPLDTNDSDGDGVGDGAEVANGTDPHDPNSVQKTAMTVSKLSAKMNFTASGKDSIGISGVLPDLPANFDPAGAQLAVNAGGASVVFTLDPKGRARAAEGSAMLKLKFKRNKATRALERVPGPVPFKILLKHGTWSDDWADEGVDPAASENGSMNLAVDLVLGGQVYTATVSAQYSGKAGKSGRFRN